MLYVHSCLYGCTHFGGWCDTGYLVVHSDYHHSCHCEQRHCKSDQFSLWMWALSIQIPPSLESLCTDHYHHREALLVPLWQHGVRRSCNHHSYCLANPTELLHYKHLGLQFQLTSPQVILRMERMEDLSGEVSTGNWFPILLSLLIITVHQDSIYYTTRNSIPLSKQGNIPLT